MNVLLVEPNYKNKYPPMGLMKISTYHKLRGDKVFFYKGCLDSAIIKKEDFDRVYVTSLFTFYFQKTMDTAKYYQKYFSNNNIYVGGIMTTIMPELVKNELGNIVLLTGLLTNSHILGLNDNINIDELPLDYSILDESEYKYPVEENYFSYTTRGCPNKCAFCAVPILEPEYKITNNIYNQIMDVNRMYGEKRNLLLLDNNIFNMSEAELTLLVQDLHNAGFTKQPTYIRETPYERLVRNPKHRSSNRVIDETEKFLTDFKSRIKNKQLELKYMDFLIGLKYCLNKKIYMCGHKKEILPIILKYKYKTRMRRYIDFNQGLEAGRITKEKMEILSLLPLRPVRIAFDHYNRGFVEKYKRAIEISQKCGIKEFSNYMLYNYDDRPEDLWYRLKVNIDLAKELKINIFSFPMKYMPINETDRTYIGKYWNKKYLSAVQGILLVTKGIVADGDSFFYRAFGSDIKEYFTILAMPKDFITYRKKYEELGLTDKWRTEYLRLNDQQKRILIDVLSNKKSEPLIEFNEILKFYSNEFSYDRLMDQKKK